MVVNNQERTEQIRQIEQSKRKPLNVLLSYQAWKIMKNMILTCNGHELYTIQKLANATNMSRYNQTFNETIRYMLDNSLIIIIKIEGIKQIVKLNIKAITKVVEDSQYYEEVAEYIRRTRLIYANI